jgi:hypothetical protein
MTPRSPLLPGEDSPALVETELAAWLDRLMRFAKVTPEELRHSVVARNKLALYVDLDRQLNRQLEVRDLETQWNPLGRFDLGAT